MTSIPCPFGREMLVRMVEGAKICTTRSRRYGRVGDSLQCTREYDGVFVGIEAKQTTQIRTRLGLVAEHLFLQEGFLSTMAFIYYFMDRKNDARKKWGRKPADYDPDALVWVHWFGRKPMPKKLIKLLVVKGTKVSRTLQKKLEA